jgi:hypothetical protein
LNEEIKLIEILMASDNAPFLNVFIPSQRAKVANETIHATLR